MGFYSRTISTKLISYFRYAVAPTVLETTPEQYFHSKYACQTEILTETVLCQLTNMIPFEWTIC